MHHRLIAKVVAEMPHAVTAVEREQSVVRHEQAILETAIEREAMALAGHQAAVRGAEERLAEIDVAERSLLAPFPGIVVERLAKEHEWVQQGEPVVHLVRMETLRAEAFLDMAEAAPADVAGKPVRVSVAVGAGRQDVFEGLVSFVSPVLEADGAYRVRVEIANRRDRRAWLLRPGMVGELTIAIGEPPASDAEPLVSNSTTNEEPQDAVELEPIVAERSNGQQTTAGEAESPISTPTEIRGVDTPEAARLELALDDEIVAAMTDEDPNDVDDASDEAIVVNGEAGDDAGR